MAVLHEPDVDAPAVAVRATEHLRSRMNSLTPAEQKVAGAMLAHHDEVMHLSVSQLAALADSSVATVVRCCQSLGFRGYQDLKIAFARESALPQRLVDVVEPEDSPSDVVAKVLHSSAAALEASARSVDSRRLMAVAELLLGARRILFSAVGTSAPLAADAAYRLTTIGLWSSAPGDVHTQHVSARLLGPGDVCFVISHTGSTNETVPVAAAAKAAGATTVALTSFSISPLTDVVDVALVAGSSETSHRVEAMASRLVHLAVLDALFVLIAMSRPDTCGVALQMTADILSEHRY